MKLPFTTQEFLEVFKHYNTWIYPLQLLFLLMAAISLLLVFQKRKSNGKVVFFLLAAFWLWMGAVYHIVFFSAINKAAYAFGVLFIAEGLLLFLYGRRGTPQLAFSKDAGGIAGALMLLYALIIYPLLGLVAGHSYPHAPTFGLPCPTTIFTFGMLSLSRCRVPSAILIIPVAWAFIGFTAAFRLGIPEDAGLPLSAVAFTIINFTKPENLRLKNA